MGGESRALPNPPLRAMGGLCGGFLLALLVLHLCFGGRDPLGDLPRLGEEVPGVFAPVVPTFLPFERPEGEVRVFVVGASLTYGLPYFPPGAASFATLCGRGLQAVLPGRALFVRPEARPAWDSVQVLEAAHKLLQWNPSGLVLVLGPNEFVNRILLGRRLLPDTLRGWWEGQLGGGRELFRRLEPRKEGTGGDFQSALHRARPGRPLVGGLPVGERDRELLMERLSRGLRALHRACAKKGTRLALALAIQGMDGFPPWSSGEGTGPPGLDSLLSAVQRDPRKTQLPEIEAWLGREPFRADLHYARGRVLLLHGRREEARESFLRALDLDRAPLHQTRRVRRALKGCAEELGLPFLDLNQALQDEGGVTGGERFLDYSHADLEGQKRLAWFLARRLGGSLLPEIGEEEKGPFFEAIERHLAQEVQPESIRKARPRIALNEGRYFLFFGNFRDALPFLEYAARELREAAADRDLAFCLRHSKGGKR